MSLAVVQSVPALAKDRPQDVRAAVESLRREAAAHGYLLAVRDAAALARKLR